MAGCYSGSCSERYWADDNPQAARACVRECFAVYVSDADTHIAEKSCAQRWRGRNGAADCGGDQDCWH